MNDSIKPKFAIEYHFPWTDEFYLKHYPNSRKLLLSTVLNFGWLDVDPEKLRNAAMTLMEIDAGELALDKGDACLLYEVSHGSMSVFLNSDQDNSLTTHMVEIAPYPANAGYGTIMRREDLLKLADYLVEVADLQEYVDALHAKQTEAA
jgi:hypothetical protein